MLKCRYRQWYLPYVGRGETRCGVRRQVNARSKWGSCSLVPIIPVRPKPFPSNQNCLGSGHHFFFLVVPYCRRLYRQNGTLKPFVALSNIRVHFDLLIKRHNGVHRRTFWSYYDNFFGTHCFTRAYDDPPLNQPLLAIPPYAPPELAAQTTPSLDAWPQVSASPVTQSPQFRARVIHDAGDADEPSIPYRAARSCASGPHSNAHSPASAPVLRTPTPTPTLKQNFEISFFGQLYWEGQTHTHMRTLARRVRVGGENRGEGVLREGEICTSERGMGWGGATAVHSERAKWGTEGGEEAALGGVPGAYASVGTLRRMYNPGERGSGGERVVCTSEREVGWGGACVVSDSLRDGEVAGKASERKRRNQNEVTEVRSTVSFTSGVHPLLSRRVGRGGALAFALAPNPLSTSTFGSPIPAPLRPAPPLTAFSHSHAHPPSQRRDAYTPPRRTSADSGAAPRPHPGVGVGVGVGHQAGRAGTGTARAARLGRIAADVPCAEKAGTGGDGTAEEGGGGATAEDERCPVCTVVLSAVESRRIGADVPCGEKAGTGGDGTADGGGTADDERCPVCAVVLSGVESRRSGGRSVNSSDSSERRSWSPEEAGAGEDGEASSVDECPVWTAVLRAPMAESCLRGGSARKSSRSESEDTEYGTRGVWPMLTVVLSVVPCLVEAGETDAAEEAIEGMEGRDLEEKRTESLVWTRGDWGATREQQDLGSFMLSAHSLAGVCGSAPKEIVGTKFGGDACILYPGFGGQYSLRVET
ncbi:hypothetical protein B0H13DRAFT_2270219 [Mycena leptocephala]|nr:hypothetical protein B0H13DRAFT_2270219 [Mycena leptocephala]